MFLRIFMWGFQYLQVNERDNVEKMMEKEKTQKNKRCRYCKKKGLGVEYKLYGSRVSSHHV